MVSNRPLIYLSLPGLALIIGLCWLHRKNSKKYKGVENNNSDEIHVVCEQENKKKTDSIKIDRKIQDEENSDIKFGKSAPINIQNGRCPLYFIDEQIDSEILNLKVFQNDNIFLQSINEDVELTSSVDLPGSLKTNTNSKSVKNNEEYIAKPLIIKATQNAKISPENSFLESKYTEEDQNNLNLNSNEDEQEISKQRTNEQSDIKLKNSLGTFKKPISPQSEAIRKVYQFLIPINLLPRLCGRKGSYLNQIKSKSQTNIILKKHPNIKIKTCIIEGTENEINLALSLIRARLPKDHYPNFTLEKVDLIIPSKYSFSLAESQLRLVEGVNNDVSVSAVISGGHLFVQHPLHPSHPSLSILQIHLNEYYSLKEAPMLPEIIENAICVGNINDMWYRLQVMSKSTEDEGQCLVKLLDFGGFASISICDLRQIKADFMFTPFQASECCLSNIIPKEKNWSVESAKELFNITKGLILQAQVIGYTEFGTPEIHLFAKLAPNYIMFINKELVARDMARWIDDYE